MNAHWKVCSFEKDPQLSVVASNLLSGLIVIMNGVRIGVWTDSPKLHEDLCALLYATEGVVLDGFELFFFKEERDAPVVVDENLRRFVCYGGEHYGRLKSLICAIASFTRESSRRMGCHASVFGVYGEGVAVLAPPGFGKSWIVQRMKRHADFVVTDDWCDIEIGVDGCCAAYQVDGCVSYNERDVLNKHIEGASCGRMCNCGWRRKLFAPLSSIGLPITGSCNIDVLFVVVNDLLPRDVDVNECLAAILKTAPHLPFSDVCEGAFFEEHLAGRRRSFAEELMSSSRMNRISLKFVSARDAQRACDQIERYLHGRFHRRLVSELQKIKGDVSKFVPEEPCQDVHLEYKASSVSQICRENQEYAQRLLRRIVESGVPILTYFVHGSTGKGRGQIAPNIDWSFDLHGSIKLVTHVMPDCRDDIDVVCVCDGAWRSYVEIIVSIIRDVIPVGVDLTLNLIGRDEIMNELSLAGSPAMRRIVGVNSPMVLYGDEFYAKLCCVVKENWGSFDYAHEIDFKTLMQLSGLLARYGVQEFVFAEGEVMSLFPTLWISESQGVHVGFPKDRVKLKR